MKKIICVHLYNDYSGSPLVLSNVIQGFLDKGLRVELLSSASKGFLSNLKIKKRIIPYQFSTNKLARLSRLLISQWRTFLSVFKYRKRDVVIYINTLLPFGAALAGKLTGKTVIYHIHETSIHPLIFKKFLKFIATITASQVIYVSKYLMQTEPIKGVKTRVVHNALSKEFVAEANEFITRGKKNNHLFTVLMLCSLKQYKGVDEYIAIAQSLPTYQFQLVLNASIPEINDYFDVKQLPKNLVLFPKQKDVHWFYQHADLVVNLSDPNQWIETFGMTLLEAMSYGIPVIAPNVGGPTEIVQHGINGYLMDVKEVLAIKTVIEQMATNKTLYNELSRNALQSSALFKEASFQQDIIETITETAAIRQVFFLNHN